jgi:hypothetical protein
MKKVIIIIAIMIAMCIAATMIFYPIMPEISQEITDIIDIKSDTGNINIASEKEVFYIENEALRLENLTGHITYISVNNDDYSILLGYSEYPMIIRKDLYADPDFKVNSTGTDFLICTELNNENVLFFSDGEGIKKLSDTDVLMADFFNKDESIFWICTDEETNTGKLKIMNNGEITVLSEKVGYLINDIVYAEPFWSFPDENALIWKEYNSDDSGYKTYLYLDGITGLLGENINIIDETTDTEKIYYTQKGESEIFCQNAFDYENRMCVMFSYQPEIFIDTVYPKNSAHPDEKSEYYYYTENADDTINIFSFIGANRPILEKSVKKYKTFSNTQNFIYSDDEYIYLYDGLNENSVVLAEMHDWTVYTALSDLSEIYVCEWNAGWTSTYSDLYAIKPNGTKELIDDYILDFTASGDTFYYLSGRKIFTRKNGKNELLTELSFDLGYVSDMDLIVDENGYFIVNIHSASEYEEYDYYKSNYLLSVDGKNFVGLEDYVK